MEVLTGLGKTILSTENEKQLLDQSVKTILAYKPILARILKETAVECKDMSPDDIEVCIEGEVQISSIYVDSGLSNTEENNISEKIDGLNTEAYINDDNPRYDILTAVIVNVGRNCDPKDTESALIRMLSVLFDKQITTTEKFNKLKNEHGLKLTKEIQEEVTTMCNYADAVEQEGINIGFKQGIEQGIEQGIKKSLAALVRSLKVYIKDFESLYSAVISNEEYKDVTRDEVKNCLIQDQS